MRSNLPVAYTPERYDEYAKRALDAYDPLTIRRVVREYRARGGGPGILVDVCTGTGRLLSRIAAVPEFAALKFVGFDYFDNMVQQARRTVRELGLESRVTILQADVHRIPFADGHAGFVVGRSVIHHWADPPAAYREIHRILAPGGVAIIHEPRRDPDPAAYAEFKRARAQLGIPPANLEEKYTVEEVREQLRGAGLSTCSRVTAGRSGAWALCFELRIKKMG